MALTGRVIFSSYPYSGNGHQLNKMGVSHNLPSALVKFYAAEANTKSGTVTINSIVELLPTGLNQKGQKYYTDSTVTQLSTNGN